MANFMHHQQQDQIGGFFPNSVASQLPGNNQMWPHNPSSWQQNPSDFHGNHFFATTQQPPSGYPSSGEFQIPTSTSSMTSPTKVKDEKKPKKKKRKRDTSPMTSSRLKKMRRNKANDRERNRMHGLNDALEELR